jgi:hypothetical protein
LRERLGVVSRSGSLELGSRSSEADDSSIDGEPETGRVDVP